MQTQQGALGAHGQFGSQAELWPWLSLGKSQPLQLMLLSSHFSPSEQESMKPCDELTGRKTIAYGAVDLDGLCK